MESCSKLSKFSGPGGRFLPSTKFLFWNINRKPLAEVVADLAETHSIDIVVLAECANHAGAVLKMLNSAPRKGGFHLTYGLSPAVTIFTRFGRRFLRPVFESDRISIRRLALPIIPEMIVASVHLPSKLHWTSEGLAFECAELARRIADEEDKAGHQRTVLLGDFNMNPFEPGLVAAGALNAVMSRQIAARLVRRVQGRDYRFFYNPMWAHFGDARMATAGSYYYDNSEHVSYFWHLFDQVLIRPELSERFDTLQLKIITDSPSQRLVRQDGRPDAAVFSDHLPLMFGLNF